MNVELTRVAVTAAAVSGLATGVVVRWLLRRGNLDLPNDRSSHSVPVPRGGGIAVIIATLSGAITAGMPNRLLLVPLVASVTIGLIGVAEDLHGLSAKVRLAAQLVIATFGGLALRQGEYSAARIAAQIVVVICFVTVLSNVVNFMDGINGITTAQAVVGGLFYAWYGTIENYRPLQVGGLALAGAMVSFLPFNFPRARVFLGDSGSYFIGAWLAFFAASGWVRGLNPFVLLTPLVLYLADTFTTILWRLSRNQPLMDPHRDHAYQRVVKAGWSHVAMTSTVLAVLVLQSATVLAAIDADGWKQLAAAFVVTLVTALYLVLPFVVARRARRATRVLRDHPIDGATPTTRR